MKPAAIPQFPFSVVSRRRERASHSLTREDAQLEDHEPLASGHEASAASPSKTKAAQPARGAKSECPGTQRAPLFRPVSRFYFFVTL